MIESIEKLHNKKVDLYGTVYTIKIQDAIKENENNKEYYGLCNHSEKVIYVARTFYGKKVSKSAMYITLLHEVMHSIFNEGQYKSCNNDEPLVEWCARCLYKIKKTLDI